MFAGNIGVFHSIDSGLIWTQFALSTRKVNALVSYGAYLFAGTDTGVFLSSDSGLSWKNVSQGMGAQPGHQPNVTFLAIVDTTLYANVDAGEVSGSERGYITGRPISEMVDTTKSAVQESPPLTTTLAIYPNPLANTATITYSLAANSSVSLTIADALGREVAFLVTDEPQVTGTYYVNFDASQLPSGVYLCRLTTGSEEKFEKLIIRR
jgi:hypothetical protein